MSPNTAVPDVLKLFALFAWLLAIVIPLYVLALFPLADAFGSAVAGARNQTFPWQELLLVSSPLLAGAVAMVYAAMGLRRKRAVAARVFAATLAALLAIDGLLLAFYRSFRPIAALDYRPVGGLRLSTWQFLDSLFFSAWITGSVFLAVLLGFLAWYPRPRNRSLFH